MKKTKVSKTTNPYQGLKLQFTALSEIQIDKFQKPLIPIRD